MLFLFVYIFLLIFFFGNRKAFIGKNEQNRVLGYSGFFFSRTHSTPPPLPPPSSLLPPRVGFLFTLAHSLSVSLSYAS